MANIIFESISFKNFFSFGNQPTTIKLNKSNTTLIQGQSGSGKSTILEAITFCLFGRPFRDIKKKTAVNTVNGKDCVVECTFTIQATSYKVVRGMKPDIFEIYINDEMVDQTAHNRDYQKYLEESILQFSYKTWVQVIALGFANYSPFLWLSSGERRQFVDEILGTGIFQKMLIKSNKQIQEIRNDLSIIDAKTIGLKTSISNSKSYLATLQKQDENRIHSLKDQIVEEREQISIIEETISMQAARALYLAEIIINKDDINKKLYELTRKINNIKDRQSFLERDIKFFETNDTCPACAQTISNDHSTNLISIREQEYKQKELERTSLYNESEKVKRQLDEIETTEQQIRQIRQSIENSKISLKHHNTLLEQKEIDLSNIASQGKELISEVASNIVKMLEEQNQYSEQRGELNEKVRYIQMAQQLLREDGIKSNIIKSYIPLLNNTINKYLDAMGFHMRFALNEEFEETILARFRDNMSFGNLSQGEQSRINLAIILAWRNVAMSRNSVSTNLIFFDEICDSALAASDVDSVMALLKNIGEDLNVFMISHKPDLLISHVRSVITVEKSGNFSKII